MRKMSARAVSRCSAAAGSLLTRGVEDAVELGMHGQCGVGLVIDRSVQQRSSTQAFFGVCRHEVGGVNGCGIARQAAPGRVAPIASYQAAMRIGGHQSDGGEAAGRSGRGRTAASPRRPRLRLCAGRGSAR